MQVNLTTTQMNPDGVRPLGSLQLPEGWTMSRVRHTHAWRSHQFCAPGCTEVCIQMLNHKQALQDSDGAVFGTILNSPDHRLVPREIERLYPVIRYQADTDHFQLTSARTQNWNGRRAIVTEGYWLDMTRRCFSIFVALDRRCNWVQEIGYSAPMLEFELHLDEAISSLRTLNWDCVPADC